MSHDPFREEVRAWLRDHSPPELAGTCHTPFSGYWGGRRGEFPSAAHARWFDCMSERGWTAPEWPVEYGGGGLSDANTQVLREEIRALGLPYPLVGLGLTMIGPILLAFGSPEQKAEHLPAIARGRIRWCQGYSEPEAGSDLASLRTRGEIVGDRIVVNGQKVWTSHADVSDWIFCLVRTSNEPRKHDGITFLLLDLAAPGIAIRPISLLSGSSPFCETFFTDVVVPRDNVVGALGAGWKVAMSLLGHERTMVGESVAGGGARPDVLAKYSLRDHAVRVVGTTAAGELKDPLLRDAIAANEMERESLLFLLDRVREVTAAGSAPGALSSVLKIAGTELNMRHWEIAAALPGQDGLGWEGPGYAEEELAISRTWLRSRANSIEGGTTEIQLNILAHRVLGLPR